jgi:hypothetical protein
MIHEVFYVIKHLPTGGYLPEPPGHLRNRGYTHWEPTRDYTPRLFRDEASAKRALTWWLKGTTTAEMSYDYETGAADGEDFHTQPKPERKREEMYIAPCILAETSGS